MARAATRAATLEALRLRGSALRSSAQDRLAADPAHEKIDAFLAVYFEQRKRDEERELAALKLSVVSNKAGSSGRRKGPAGSDQQAVTSSIPAGLHVGMRPTYNYGLQPHEQCILQGQPAAAPAAAAASPRRNLVLAAVGDAFDATV